MCETQCDLASKHTSALVARMRIFKYAPYNPLHPKHTGIELTTFLESSRLVWRAIATIFGGTI